MPNNALVLCIVIYIVAAMFLVRWLYFYRLLLRRIYEHSPKYYQKIGKPMFSLLIYKGWDWQLNKRAFATVNYIAVFFDSSIQQGLPKDAKTRQLVSRGNQNFYFFLFFFLGGMPLYVYLILTGNN